VAGPLIDAEGLSKRFGRLMAVRRLHLEVNAAEVVGFLGPNGAGKTTTMRLLMGFLRPTSGWCTVLGGRLDRDVELRRRVGYLPGDVRVDPTMTGTELFAWFGRLRGGLNARRLEELLARLDLDPSRRFRELSKGNRQKVGIIQAFQHDPDVLILDEPTTGLDPLIQREFLTLVRERAAAGAAVLFSSHVLPEVERLAHRVVIIRSGQLVRTSTVEDLLDTVRHRLELHFSTPIPEETFRGVPGVVEARLDGRMVTLTVDGPVGPAVRAAVQAGSLLRVSPAGDDLEDLFVSLYSRDELSRTNSVADRGFPGPVPSGSEQVR
jgi:ABC-2 type transport system ATP-binding protein